MLRHKCPKCSNELGYKWKTSLYSKGYQCPNCKAKLETTIYVSLAMFLSFLSGLFLTDFIAPFMVTYSRYPQITKGVVTFIAIIVIWLLVSIAMPRQLRIKEKIKR